MTLSKYIQSQCAKQIILTKHVEDILNKLISKKYPKIAEKWKIVLVPNDKVDLGSV